MTDENGWLFGFGVHKIHYFINGISLCGKVQSGLQSWRASNISKPIALNHDDSRACKRCLFMLKTYSDLKNKL